ncbi:hypothetical protein Trydic_g19045 [Trypoxylus dichotomus]
MLSLLLCIGVAAAASLDNLYLPPSNTPSRRIDNTYLPPLGISRGRLGNTYLPPSNRRIPGGSGVVVQQYSQTQAIVAPSPLYGAPVVPAGPSPVYGAPSGRAQGSAEARANILRYNNENNGDGNYRFEYETENRISQQEVGQVKNLGQDGDATVVQGTYSYVGDDGQTYTVNYVADENGFQPAGDHIHKEIQAVAAEAARTAVSDVGYPSNTYSSQGGYRY